MTHRRCLVITTRLSSFGIALAPLSQRGLSNLSQPSSHFRQQQLAHDDKPSASPPGCQLAFSVICRAYSRGTFFVSHGSDFSERGRDGCVLRCDVLRICRQAGVGLDDIDTQRNIRSPDRPRDGPAQGGGEPDAGRRSSYSEQKQCVSARRLLDIHRVSSHAFSRTMASSIVTFRKD